MAVGIQTFQTLYKTCFPKKDLPWLIPSNLPFLNLIPKSDSMSGDIIDHPFKYGAAQGYSADFTTAQAQSGTAPRAVRAQIRYSQAYDFVEFFDKDKEFASGDGAYGDLIVETLKGKYADFLKNTDLDAHAGGTGWRGTVAAIPGQTNPFTGATLPANTIAVAAGFALEAVFDQDQLIQAATYAGFPLAGSIFPPADGRLPTTLSAGAQVVAVDANARTLTLTDASQFAVGAFIVNAGGAIGFSSNNLYGAMIGMDAWNPYGGVASNDSFCGINRSVYPTRLAGYSFDGSRLSMEDALKRAAAKMSQGGARESNVILVNPMDFDALDSKLMSSVRYAEVGTATYGFQSIVLNTAAGRADVISDPHQLQGYARIIDPSTWLLGHKLDLPHLVDVEDRNMEQAATFDGRTARIRAYLQLFCYEPYKNAVVKLAQIAY